MDPSLSLVSLVSTKIEGLGKPFNTVLLRRLLEPGQYVSRRIDYHDRSGRPEDRATVTREMIEWFAREWSDLETRVCIVPGKRTLAEFRRLVQDAYSVSLTNHQLISGFTKAQVPTDLQKLLYGLDEFRRTVPGIDLARLG